MNLSSKYASRAFVCNLLAAFLFSAPLSAQDDRAALAAFADPSRVWGNGAESLIEAAYRQCFKSFIIGGKVMNLRMPFAENHERDSLVKGGWEVLGKGKADAASLWPVITAALESDDFKTYGAVLADGKEKVIIFDIPQRKWTVSEDLFDIARMKAGSYHGLPHKPYVLVAGAGIAQSAVNNDLYCTAWAGMDCSAFGWHTLSYIARSRKTDLGRRLAYALGAPRGADPSIYAGTAFYNSGSREISAPRDLIKNLRPADIILFRAKDGEMAHSAIIQSVDFSKGVIRYLQETDEAPQEERGVHESYIYFNPRQTNISLKDKSLVWTQKRFSPFPGEKDSAFSDDGERYRAYGGGRVVRLKLITRLIG
ncbi:MAG: peptidoglycan endopeptidase [Spirochaetaceae bacterium]|nr:peptidoglycan endopeptidase [Spirochaetaceae bacterium]